MFVALEVVRQDGKNLSARLKRFFSPSKARLEPRELCGIQYAAITAKPGRHGLDWDEIESLASRCSRWILLPEDIELPSWTSLRPYNTGMFDRQVLIQTACELIQHSNIPMYRRILGILDPDGSSSDMLYQLLKYYTSVQVVTHNLSCYEDVAKQMMDELGAPVLVSERLSSLADCALILAPGAFASDEDSRLPCPVLSMKTSDLSLRYSCDIISNLRVEPPTLFSDVPQGISPHLFAGALRQLCDVGDVSLTADIMLFCNRLTRFDDVVTAIRQSAGVSY